MKYFIFTLGCQMNTSDSERIATILNQKGYCSSNEKSADLIVINACSVRQKAVDRIWGGIKKWQTQHKKIILTGCVLPDDQGKMAEKGVLYTDFHDNYFFEITPELSSDTSFIPIMSGCDNFCSYCAVPYTRGREKSRPVSKIIAEVKIALKKRRKKILLLGQNVNSYKYGFAKLLKKIDNIPGDFEFNFISSNPHDMTDEIVSTFSKLKKWPRELHLAMQSGNDEILKRMNRKYTSGQFLKLVQALKSYIPDLMITTDIIVGFPGETKKQFEDTVKICKKIGFSKAYVSQYSPRPGTVAAKLKDDIPADEKKKRWKILNNLINQ